MRGRVVLVVIGLLVAGALVGVLTFLGVPAEFAIAWLVLVAAVGIVTRQTLSDHETSWPPPKPKAPFRGSEVSRLAWGINARTGVVGTALVRRLDTILRARLALHGLDADDPSQHARIDAMLGSGIRSVLHQRVVTRAEVERVLDAIESIPPALELR